METVKVTASRSYEVRIAPGILKDAGDMIAEVFSGKTAVIVSDDNVWPLYGEALEKSISDAGFATMRFVFPSGERSKNLAVYGELLEAMCAARISRSDAIVALGGGVVGDLAGFAAATYQRGISFIQIPTTLLAAVDSSVGGKTAVDLESGKNQVGAFYQPSLVICDTDTLDTLPQEEYHGGCAEIIKYAMIGSGELFDDLMRTPVRDSYESVIKRCVSMKRDFVERDERDLGCRMMLNFGHTIGHAIEACSRYEISHGAAVAIGMAMITKAAHNLGYCGIDVQEKLLRLLDKYLLGSETDFGADELCAAAMTDKKSSGDSMTIVVPEEIGRCSLLKIKREDFINWLKAGGSGWIGR